MYKYVCIVQNNYSVWGIPVNGKGLGSEANVSVAIPTTYTNAGLNKWLHFHGGPS